MSTDLRIRIHELLATDVDKLTPADAQLLITKILDAATQSGVTGEESLKLQNLLVKANTIAISQTPERNTRDEIRDRIATAIKNGDTLTAQRLQQGLVDADQAEIQTTAMVERVQAEQQERFQKFADDKRAALRRRRDEAIARRTEELVSRTDVPMDLAASRRQAEREVKSEHVYRELGE
ncbi:MAG: hypothetical protein AAF270_05830 [Pseudomonadota bacterium]